MQENVSGHVVFSSFEVQFTMMIQAHCCKQTQKSGPVMVLGLWNIRGIQRRDYSLNVKINLLRIINFVFHYKITVRTCV